MTDQEKIAELEAKIAQMQQEQQPKPKMNIKMGNKQNVVVGGAALKQRFPVTLRGPVCGGIFSVCQDVRYREPCATARSAAKHFRSAVRRPLAHA